MASSTTVWLITGVNAGFGLELCSIARKAGHTVYGTVRAASKFPAALQEAGVKPITLPLPCDDATSSSIIQSIVAAEGRLDVLVNNAGYAHLAMVEEVTSEDMTEQFAVNVHSPFSLIRAVLPVFRKQQAAGITPSGTIVNLSSMAGLMGFVGSGVYCASKYALEGMTETLAMEVSDKFDVRVHIVEPGFFRTSFLSFHGAGGHNGTVRLPDAYPQSAAEMYAAYHKNQPGDPHKGMQRLFEFVTGTGMAAGKPDLHKQLRLLLGTDACQMTQGKIKSFQDNLDLLKDMSMSTDLS